MGSKSARIEEIEEEDMISQLDDKLIIEILSLLPEADAKQTRLVSKSWKNHWAFLPSLRFVMPNGSSIEEANKFHDFVDQTLALRRVCDVSSTSLSMTPSLSVMEAHITANPNVVAQLLPCLWSVKILILGGFTLVGLSEAGGLNIPVFPNLVKLSVGRVSVRGWNMLWSLLGNMPNLEHITFLDGFLPFPRTSYLFHIGWHAAQVVPPCLQFKMKEIAVLNPETIAQEEFESLRYLLEHSNSLETLTINAHEIDAVTREQILNFRPGSSSCGIQFV